MQALTTILNPGILFFLLGVAAALLRSNLTVPEPIVRFVGLYLMLSIGFKGGTSLHASGMSGDGVAMIAIILAMSAFVPAYSSCLLRRRVGVADAAAIGATYGSNSTLTYITAAGFLTALGIPYGGHMTVALVVMETPAIILSVAMAHRALREKGRHSTSRVLRDAMTDGTLVVMLGSMAIGWLLAWLGEERSPLAAFVSGDMFTGMLVFFLLHMGTVVGARLGKMAGFPPVLWVFAIVAPLVNAAIAILLSRWFGFSHGDALLLTILCASASYIVAPAILKDTLPQADPARFLTMSIGITFPLNVAIGIPLYWWAIRMWV